MKRKVKKIIHSLYPDTGEFFNKMFLFSYIKIPNSVFV